MIVKSMVLKNKYSILFFLFLLIPSVHAGVGIKYGIESVNMNDEWEHCVEYGVYNPWPDNSTILLSAGGEIEQFALESKEIIVPSYTTHDISLDTEICFKPEIFPRDCLVGDWFLCKKECAEESRVFNGEVLASEISSSAGGGTGSAATVTASAPLRINVKCIEYERNWVPVILFIAAIIIIIVAFIVIKQMRKPVTRVKKLKEYKKLQQRLTKMRRNLKK